MHMKESLTLYEGPSGAP